MDRHVARDAVLDRSGSGVILITKNVHAVDRGLRDVGAAQLGDLIDPRAKICGEPRSPTLGVGEGFGLAW